MLFKTYRGLPGSVYILFLARIVNRFGDFVKIFLTLYLTRYLNLDESQTGIIITMIGISSVLGTITGGKIADQGDRKRILLGAQFLSATMAGICGFIPDSHFLPWILVFFNFFTGAARPVSSAILTDLTSPENRAQSFSLLYLGINIGVAVGPLVAGFLFNNFRQWIFWGDSLTTFLSIILIAVFIPSISASKAVAHSEKEKEETAPIHIALIRRPVLLIYSILILFSSLVYSQHTFSLPLLLESRMHEEGARFFGILMSINAVSVLVLTPFLTALLYRIKPLINMAAGQFCYALGFGMLFFSTGSYYFFIFSTVVWTLGEILNVINSGVFVANHTPVNYRGRFSAWFGTARTIGFTSAPMISGFVLGRIGLQNIWILAGLLGLILFLSFLWLYRFDRKS